MICGIGAVILQLSCVEAALVRSSERFDTKVLGPEELEKHKVRKKKVSVRGILSLAMRSRQGDVSKAVGCGTHLPMTWHAMQTLNVPDGKPIAVTNGR